MLETIDAVNWGGIPGPADLYEPDRAAAGLRALATATDLVQAADAGSVLASGGLVHDHSGAVFPAAATAAPLLLAIARHGHPQAGATALGLLDDALAFATCDGRTRVATPYAEAVPICCALADHIRGGTELLAARGREGKWLLADAAAHWRFDVQETVAEGDGIAVLGALAGRFPDGAAPEAAELHRAGRRIAKLEQVVLACPPEDGGSEAYLRIDAVRPDRHGVRMDGLGPPAVLLPARCAPEPTNR